VFATITGGATAANMTDVTFVGTPTTGMPAKYIARTVIDPNNANTAYVVFNGNAIAGRHVWKTTNLNNTGTGTVAWTAIDGTGIPDVSVNAFVVDRADSTHLYAGTDRGVFLSTDGGTTWNQYGDQLRRSPACGDTRARVLRNCESSVNWPFRSAALASGRSCVAFRLGARTALVNRLCLSSCRAASRAI